MAPALRQARFAAAAGFFTQGLVFISLTTRLPVVQEKWDALLGRDVACCC